MALQSIQIYREKNRFKCEIETVTVKSSEVICNIITSIIAK